jgi:predicted transcriptional regulator
MVDVMADILRVAAQPASKTQILYAANLSYEQARKYCDLLLECGMLSKVAGEGKDGARFVTTPSGSGFIAQMSGFGSISPGESSVWERKNPNVWERKNPNV